MNHMGTLGQYECCNGFPNHFYGQSHTFFSEVAVDEDVDGACWRWRDGAACFADGGGGLMGSMGVVMIKKLVQIFVMIGMVGKV